MNYELYRLLKKKRRVKTARSNFMSQSMVLSSHHSGKANRLTQKHIFSNKLSQIKSQKKDSKFPNKIQNLAQNLKIEFSVPRNPNKQGEFSFEKSKSKSKEIILSDNFSFSENIHGHLKRKKTEEQDAVPQTASQTGSVKSSSGVFGSICSTIMSRYNSFIQVFQSLSICKIRVWMIWTGFNLHWINPKKFSLSQNKKQYRQNLINKYKSKRDMLKKSKSAKMKNIFNVPSKRNRSRHENIELGKRGNIFYDKMSMCFDDDTNSAKSLSTSSVLSLKKRSKKRINKSSFFFF